MHDLLQQSSFTRTLDTGIVLELTRADTMVFVLNSSTGDPQHLWTLVDATSMAALNLEATTKWTDPILESI